MRVTYKIMEFDYLSHKEFLNHRKEMIKRGWNEVEAYDIEDGKYKCHAIYHTGVLFNGINGR